MPAVLEERRPSQVVSSPAVASGLETVPPQVVAPPVAVKKRRKPVLIGILLTLVVVGIAVAVYEFVYYSRFVTTDDAFIEGHVVAISPQVSARVQTVLITDNMLVTKGQLMVQLDSTDYDIAVNQAKATETAMAGKALQAGAEIKSADAGLKEADAELEVAKANYTNAGSDLNRYKELKSKNDGAVSRQQFDSAVAVEASNGAQVRQAEAKQARAVADVETKKATADAAQGDLLKARADVTKAETNQGYCKIFAPENGRVTRKNVEEGSYVQTGEQMIALVQPNVWVVANFKETELDKMKVGDKVDIQVDAYPGMKLHGHIDTFQYGTGSRFSMLPAENATGNFVKVVQRVPTKIVLDNVPNDPNHPLALGMSVEPEVSLK